ncbi:potassium-transporting ATPase subunit F [Candidatus Bipolaricaulota bacterium]|nr:potassium-transporting ATPase subunit F [Candidatus Bipolaricaulota bacterium]
MECRYLAIGRYKMGGQMLLGIVAGFIFLYLGYVLLYPERF